MKITDRQVNVNFGDIQIGEVFRDTNDNVCIKIEDLFDKGLGNHGSINAIILVNGEATFYFADEKVFRINTELIVS